METEIPGTTSAPLADIFLPRQLVCSRHKRGDRAFNDILVDTDAPVFPALTDDLHIRRRLRRRTRRDRVLLIGRKLIAHAEVQLDRIADRVKPPVPGRLDHAPLLLLLDRHLRRDPVLLLEMALRYAENILQIHVVFLKNPVNRPGSKLLVAAVRHALHEVSDLLLHLIRQRKAKVLL